MDCSMNYSAPPRSLLDLPNSVLEMLMSLLDVESLVRLGYSCRLLQELATRPALWESPCKARWREWEEDRWTPLAAEGRWSTIYARRMQIDRQVATCVADMAWPLRRGAAMAQLLQYPADVLDALRALAQASGPLSLGVRHRAGAAVARVAAARSASQLATLCERLEGAPATGAEGVRVDDGALQLAAAHYPLSRMEPVRRQLDALGRELSRRIADAGAAPDSTAALQLLGQLLFGPPPPGRLPGCWNEDTIEEAWAQGAPPDRAFDPPYVPPPGLGLGLKGNDGSYYNPSNSLINDVLARGLGIPISLAIVHAAVGHRAGMPIELVGMPMHFMTKMACRGKDGGTDYQYIDVFDGGRLYSRHRLGGFMAGIGLPDDDRLLAVTDVRSVYVRMLTNLLSIYRQNRELPRLRTVLSLLLALRPESNDFLLLLAEVCLQQQEYDEALATLDALKALPGRGVQQNLGDAMDVERWHTRTIRLKEQHARDCSKQHRRSAYPRVAFRVGDVIRHRQYQYRGVVSGWDPLCDAREDWVRQMGVDRLPGGRYQPFYAVLVDSRDRATQSTYVAQENMELADEDTHIDHADMGEFFDGHVFSAGRLRYVPNAYLQYRYPQDMQGGSGDGGL